MQKIKPIRDRKYLNSYRDARCYACGARDGTVVGAHIRSGFFGIGAKPGDDLTMPLCAKCHAIQGRNEMLFWQEVYGGRMVISPEKAVECAKIRAQRNYEMWKDRQK